MKNTLNLLGNGFELHFGLRTAWKDFDSFVNDYYRERADQITNTGLCLFKNPDNLWKDFEKALGEIDLDFCREYTQDQESLKMMYADIYSIKKEISCLFEKWLKKIDITIEEKKRKDLSFSQSIFFINFNYTETLEKNFNVSPRNIYHIHGKTGGSVIFGHAPKQDIKKICEAIHEGYETRKAEEFSAYRLLDEYLTQTEKPVKNMIEKAEKALMSLLKWKEIKAVYVIGHSYSEVDQPYFCWIKQKTSAKWFLGYYSETDRESAKSMCQKLKLKAEIQKNSTLIKNISNKKHGREQA